MIFAIFALCLYAGQVCAMAVEESLSHDAAIISVINTCPYPVRVTFDASQLKSDTGAGSLIQQKDYPKYPGDTSDTVEANVTKQLMFYRLAHCVAKDGAEKTLSGLRAIVCQNGQPSLSYSLDLNPDAVKKLIVFHDSGIAARAE